jgi:hypothetical protein
MALESDESAPTTVYAMADSLVGARLKILGHPIRLGAVSLGNCRGRSARCDCCRHGAR